ncbi:hypothetical protein, partial [Serratia marcescens]|uniref:hypothetical protein n=1 Tax=Serratia marcescens TaxID=615 RepID=UPI00195311FC
LKGTSKTIATLVVPFVAFAVVLGVNKLYGSDVTDLFGYAVYVLLAVGAFFYGQEKPVKTLITVASLAAVAMLIGVF